MKPTAWAFTATVVAAGLIIAGPSAAHTQTYKSTITIKHEDMSAKYSGRVISEREACEKNRAVKLRTEEGVVVGETTTNNKGRWKYEFVGQRYYATVAKRVDGGGAHEHVCRGDRSPTTQT